MKPRTGSPARRQSVPPSTPKNPEVVAFIAATLRQMDHAADLVAAFFRAVGMADAAGRLDLSLPPQFLLELGALLQLREWQDAGVIQWNDPEGLTVEDLIAQAIERLARGPQDFYREHRGTEAMVSVIRTWSETCATVAREHLGCDVAIKWDHGGDIEELIDSLADFAWRHRDRGYGEEAI